MDSETSTRPGVGLLESVLLDGNAEPTYVSLSLLEDITNNFSDEHEIGRGGFAVVYKGIVGKGMVAVKKLLTFSLHEEKFDKEVECLSKARHKNIVRFVGYCSDTQKRIADAGGKFVMADIRNWLLCFEYVPNGSLDKYITDISRGLEWMVRYGIIKGICEGLLHLHERRILHLDLKPGNILVDDHMLPKITDFGISKCLDVEQTRAFTSNIYGSPGYLAPEFFSGEVAFASDIYSLGVIILEILTGKKGYMEDEKVVDNWMNRLEGSDHWDVQLEQIRVCMKIGIECLNLDPKKRPVARHIVDRLDEAATTVETSISSSSVEQHVTFFEEQYHQEKTTKLASEYPGKDRGEQAETEETAEYVVKSREDHQQQGGDKALYDKWSLWEAQDSKQNVIQQGASISGSKSGVLYKMRNLNIFKKKDRTDGPDGPDGPTRRLKLFSKGDIRPILMTSNVILKDDFGEVYKGLLDNVPVTLWKISTDVDNENFANEVLMCSSCIHKNILRIIGCCLEVDNPILVYEFSEGNLQDLLHSYNKVPLNLGARLSIAAASAAGLAYMHSVANSAVIHGDFKPENILFDDNFVPKITFGRPRMTSKNIVGDITYMDPVYLQTGLLTEKSDVYSFGIVILELLTRKKASHSDNNSLVKNFIQNYEQGTKSSKLLDKDIAVIEDMKLLYYLAKFAVECLDHDPDLRPTMVEVAQRLNRLNKSRKL